MTDGKSMNWRLAARSALFLCLAGCATMGNDTGEPTQLLPLIDPPAQAGAPDLFIAMPTSINFAPQFFANSSLSAKAKVANAILPSRFFGLAALSVDRAITSGRPSPLMSATAT